MVAGPGSKPAHVDTLWLAGRTLVEGRPAAYLCRGHSCSLPATRVEELEALAVPSLAGVD